LNYININWFSVKETDKGRGRGMTIVQAGMERYTGERREGYRSNKERETGNKEDTKNVDSKLLNKVSESKGDESIPLCRKLYNMRNFIIFIQRLLGCQN
jgi:hypothetical protein